MRTNYVKNPSYEVDTADWAVNKGTCANTLTITRVANPNIGSYAAEFQYTADATDSAAYCNAYCNYSGVGTAATGESWTLSGYIKTTGTNSGVTVKLRISEFTDANGWIKDNSGSALTLSSSYQRFDYTVALSGGATTSQVYADLNFSSITNGDAFDIVVDNLLLEKAAALGDYFDGDTTDTASHTYAWTGTAHDSLSTDTESAFAGLTVARNIGP